MRDLLFHAIFVPVMLAGIYSTHICLLVWIWIALLPPSDLLYGTFGVLPFNKFVAGLAVLMMFIGVGKKDFFKDSLIIIVGIYGVVVTLSYLLAEYDSTLADLQFDKFWKEVVLFILLTGVMHSRHRLHQSLLVFSLAFAFLSVKEGLIFLLTAGGHKIVGLGVTGDNNGVALALLMTIPFALYCAKYSSNRYVSLGLNASAAFAVVTIVATYSRGGFIGLIVLGLMLIKGSRYRLRMIVATALVLGIVYAVTPGDYFTRVNTISDATSDGSFEIRLVAWKINTLLALQHPFLGVGLYGCLDYVNWISQMPFARTWLFTSPYIPISFAAHSIYFQALGDTGFLGLVLFVSMLVLAIAKTVKVETLVSKEPSLEWIGGLATALRVSIIVYMVSGAALSLLYFEPLYIILALVARTHRTAKQLTAASIISQRGGGTVPSSRAKVLA